LLLPCGDEVRVSNQLPHMGVNQYDKPMYDVTIICGVWQIGGNPVIHELVNQMDTMALDWLKMTIAKDKKKLLLLC